MHAIKGIWAALPTPYTPDRTIDNIAWQHHVGFLASYALQGIIVGGCTGEILALDSAERCHLITQAATLVPSTCKIFVGIASQSARQASEWINQAQAAGAHGALVLTPLLLRQPTATALLRYFSAIHDATEIPLLIYENPSRSGVVIATETILALAAYPRIVGLKDATSGADRPRSLLVALKKAGLKNQFSLMCGEDALYGHFLMQGAQGLIGVAPNSVPGLYLALEDAWKKSNKLRYREVQAVLENVIKMLGVAPNPMALKGVLQHVQGFSWHISRLPLDSLTLEQVAAIDHLWHQISHTPAWRDCQGTLLTH